MYFGDFLPKSPRSPIASNNLCCHTTCINPNFHMIFHLFSSTPTDDKNPDVVPQETSDDEFISEEKAFDRLNQMTHRIVYTPHSTNASPSLTPTYHNLSPSIAGFAALKPMAELSLTTNPAHALYNSRPAADGTYFALPQTTLTTPLLSTSSNLNIYTRIPTRPFTPYDAKLSPVSSNCGVTVPLLMQNNGSVSTSPYGHIDKNS